MVTREAKQQLPERQQQQHQRQPQDRECEQEEAVVADDDDNWARKEEPRCESNDIRDSDKRVKPAIAKNEWTISEVTANNLKIDKESASNKERRTSPGKEDIPNGSNGESTQCSDIEDEDELENDEELEDEEEEDEEYEVDEVDTDEEDDFDGKEVGNAVEPADRWIKKKVVTTRVQRETSFGNSNASGQSELVPHLDETSFGEVCIKNSRHVHVGNTNFYKGPVTIKQFVYTNACPILDKDDTDCSSSARVSDINPNDVPIVRNDPNGPILPSHRDYDRVTKWLWTWRCAAILCVVALSLVTIVTVASVLLSNKTDGLPSRVPDSPSSGGDEDLPGDKVRIIERESWNAQPPAKELLQLKESPTPYVIISHTATASCETQSACVLRVRLIQTFHIESFGWDDIGYNFLIGGDGLAYLGRGWDLAGSHAFGYNFNSIGISFIGTFNDVAPSKLQLQAAQRLIQMGVNISKIATSYKLLGHRQVSATLSPGDQLYKILQTWSHWSPYPAPKPNRATANNVLHSAALLPLLLILFPYFLPFCQITAGIFFDAILTAVFHTYRYTYISLLVGFTNHDKIRTIK